MLRNRLISGPASTRSRPAPARARYLGEIKNPSVAEMLGDMLAFSDEEVRYFLADLLSPAARGAYRPRRSE